MSDNEENKLNGSVNNMTLKETWDKSNETHTTVKTFAQCQKLIGGSKKYGNGGKWSKDGNVYLALNGNRSRGGQPLKLKCKDAVIPVSQTDIEGLVKNKYIDGVTPVEFE